MNKITILMMAVLAITTVVATGLSVLPATIEVQGETTTNPCDESHVAGSMGNHQLV